LVAGGAALVQDDAGVGNQATGRTEAGRTDAVGTDAVGTDAVGQHPDRPSSREEGPPVAAAQPAPMAARPMDAAPMVDEAPARAVADEALPSSAPAAAAPAPGVPAARAKSATSAAPTKTETSAKPARSSLADEVRSLDAARAALEGGDGRKALRALDAHEASFRQGVLGPEATVLRIEGLFAAGRDGEAKTLAGAFLAAHPESAYAARVRSLLAKAATNESP
jgi:hypothetical protein